jgi:hypothetical protein
MWMVNDGGASPRARITLLRRTRKRMLRRKREEES